MENLHITFQRTAYDADGTPAPPETVELWWKARNVWRTTNLTSGRYSVANGAFMYEYLGEFESGGPLDSQTTYAPHSFMSDSHIEWVLAQAKKIGDETLLDRAVTAYELTRDDIVTTYWIDQETYYPLKVIQQISSGNTLVKVEVKVIESKAGAESLYSLPDNIPGNSFMRRIEK